MYYADEIALAIDCEFIIEINLQSIIYVYQFNIYINLSNNNRHAYHLLL